MSDELKVCPFCGGDARIHSKVLTKGFDSGYWAVCDECGKGDTLPHESEEEAAAAWNARAERTCRMKPAVGGGWYCSECHIWVAPDAMANATEHMAPRYCPSCGVKVAG